jgi:hypothetical protein
MAKAGLLVLALILGLAACGDDAPTSAPGPLTLPAAFLGSWELVGTSGGIDGKGLPTPAGAKPARIVIAAKNTFERLAPDGSVSAQRFVVKRGKTIFSADDQWMIVLADGALELVLQLEPDGTLSMSENVFDGYGTSYKRP